MVATMSTFVIGAEFKMTPERQRMEYEHTKKELLLRCLLGLAVVHVRTAAPGYR